jgi:ABC-type phosphate/phosphonate transport system substrate-binding protein
MRTGYVRFLMSIMLLLVFAGGTGQAAEIKIAITQAQAGDARKFQPLLDYFGKNGIAASFTTTQNYQSAADLFASGAVNAMFSGSGIAGTMIIKELADPVARPVSTDGVSTYAAVVIAPKGSPRFAGSPDYFNGKRVIFTPLASAGEFYFHSLGSSRPKEILKAASHGAAVDALSRGQADVAIIKNHVWTKEKDKYPMYEKVGEDKGENPDGTLIVSRKMDRQTVQKISAVLLGVQNDTSAEAKAVKDSLKIRGYIPTTANDFKHTLALLKKAGVTKAFAFKF